MCTIEIETFDISLVKIVIKVIYLIAISRKKEIFRTIYHVERFAVFVVVKGYSRQIYVAKIDFAT